MMEEKSWADNQRELREEEKRVSLREEQERNRKFRDEEEGIKKSRKAKEQQAEWKERQISARTDTTQLDFGERSSISKFIVFLGWMSLLGWFLVTQNYVAGDMIIFGHKLEAILLFCGIASLIIGYVPKIAGVLVVLFGLFILFGTALSPDGLNFEHTPTGNWILGVGSILMGVLIIYSRK